MEEQRVPKKTFRYVVYVSSAILILIVALYVFAYILAGNPESCGICHEIKPSVDTWKITAHNTFNCYICHSGPGVTARAKSALRILGDFIPHITGSYSTPISVKSQIPNSYCFACHVSWRKVTASGDLVIPHEKHFKELNIQCTYCHSRVSHAYELRGKTTTRPPMTLCLQCHNGKKATMECKACHTDKPVPENHKSATWFEEHGQLAEEIDCGECHGWVVDYCNECHQKSRPSTHVGGVKWRSLHSDRASKKPKTCFVCHDNDYCLNCHDQGLFDIRLKGKI